jgi:hypothetical protein
LLTVEPLKAFNQIKRGNLSEVEGNPVRDLGPRILLPCGGVGIRYSPIIMSGSPVEEPYQETVLPPQTFATGDTVLMDA